MNRADGFITLNRKILDWEWIDDDTVFSCFVKLLLAVNHQDGKWHNMIIKRGSIVGSTATLCSHLHLKKDTYLRCRKILEECGVIKVEVKKNCYQMITIVNYDKYQSKKVVGKTDKRTDKKTSKKTCHDTDNKTHNRKPVVEKNDNSADKRTDTIEQDIYTPKGVYISEEKKKAASPARLEGGGLTAEELTYPIIRDFARSIGSNDYIAADFHTAFERSKTYFPSDWQDIFSRMVKADSGVCDEFLKDVKAGAYRVKWGSY